MGKMGIINAIIERANDGTYSVYSDADHLDYLITGTGNTAEEAITMFKNGYEDTKRFYEEEGKYFQKSEFQFVYDMSSFLSYFCKAFSLAGLSRITGINKYQLSHYLTGRRKPSKETFEKIETSIHQFAEDLNKVRFA